MTIILLCLLVKSEGYELLMVRRVTKIIPLWSVPPLRNNNAKNLILEIDHNFGESEDFINMLDAIISKATNISDKSKLVKHVKDSFAKYK